MMAQIKIFLGISLIFFISSLLFLGIYWFATRQIGWGRKSIRSRLKNIVVHNNQDDEKFLKTTADKGELYLLKLSENFLPLKKLHKLTIEAGIERGLTLQTEIIILMALTGLIFATIIHASFLLIIFIMLSLGLLPVFILVLRANKRKRLFEEQLPEALDYMSRAMRAGHGLSVALAMVGEELPAPLGPEFKRVYEEINFGIPFHEALPKMPQRLPSADLSFFVAALLIQRETGGNLTELLRGLSATIRERLKLKGRVNILAAEGKYTGYLLAAMPFVIAFVLYSMNPGYISLLWTTEIGKKLITIAAMIIIFGFYWMWKITQIKV